MNYLSVNEKYQSFNSPLAKGEKNDCVVRSIASAADISYRTAHEFCKKSFGRTDKRGTNNMNIVAQMLLAETSGLELEGKKFAVKVLGRRHLKNTYKLKGEIILRQKTLKSFVDSHKKGTFMVMIAKHALTVKDGEVFDWKSNAFKPTTKVMAAYELIGRGNSGQLNLFE
jgi:hypothetical protein|tara:strand:+ start:45 stop:554 length:510 start_codon:yes stop_codon:yes gene_type:complete